MKLSEFVEPGWINLDLPGETKDGVLSALVNVLAEGGVIQQPAPLLNSLREREGLGSTGITHGVAIPHGRSPEISRPTLVIARSRAEVDFEAMDGEPTRLFFLLVAPENGASEHLHILARIARLVRHADCRNRLLTVQTPAEVLSILEEQEGG